MDRERDLPLPKVIKPESNEMPGLVNVLVLTGGPAVGKNTIASQLAAMRERCAVIDVDNVRWMVLQPHHAPWEGEEGHFQQRLGVRNACSLTHNFIEAGFEVLILDVLIEETTSHYRKALAPYHPKIVLLHSTYEEAQRRAINRPPALTQQEFQMIHEQQKAFTAYDRKIDTTHMTADAVAHHLVELLNERGPRKI